MKDSPKIKSALFAPRYNWSQFGQTELFVCKTRFKWFRSFCIGEFPAQYLPLSSPSFLYELQIVSVMSLYFFKVTDKVWYSIATECFVCLETKFSTDESLFYQPDFYSFNRLHVYSVSFQFLKSKCLVLRFYIHDTDTMIFSNKTGNSFKPPHLFKKTVYYYFQSKWVYYNSIINYPTLDTSLFCTRLMLDWQTCKLS